MQTEGDWRAVGAFNHFHNVGLAAEQNDKCEIGHVDTLCGNRCTGEPIDGQAAVSVRCHALSTSKRDRAMTSGRGRLRP